MSDSTENIAGNYYNKYEAQNPLSRFLTDNFKSNLLDLIRKSGQQDIHELGCGEGYLSAFIYRNINPASFRATDFSEDIIETAKRLHGDLGITFAQRSIYDITNADAAPLIVCCEVLEHIENPELALQRIHALSPEYAVFSVPREPLWRISNMLRFKYLADFGNTPGHIQHWSKNAFLNLIGSYFEIIEIRSPYPWTMLLGKPRKEAFPGL
jgi:trans-aconitate methyltransferase